VSDQVTRIRKLTLVKFRMIASDIEHTILSNVPKI
jgi:hypothetical protein